MTSDTQKAFLRDMVKVLHAHGYEDAQTVLTAKDDHIVGGCDTCWHFFVGGEYLTNDGATKKFSVDGSLDTFLYQLIDL